MIMFIGGEVGEYNIGKAFQFVEPIRCSYGYSGVDLLMNVIVHTKLMIL